MHVFFNDLIILRLEHRVTQLAHNVGGGVRHTEELKHYPFRKRHIIKEHTDFQALVPASTKFCPISVQKLGAKNPFALAPHTLAWLI